MTAVLDMRGEEDWDAGIRYAVAVLRRAGIETFESCQGGFGHACPEPVVRFGGPPAEGFRAYAVALQHGLPVFKLQRTWRIDDGELTGPWWEMVFSHVVDGDEDGSTPSHGSAT
jgi:hypothetical protein